MKKPRSNIFTQRFTKKTKKWSRYCLRRDGWRCLLCGAKKPLHVHHLERWIDAPHKRLDPDNGATLCVPCHTYYHNGTGERFPAHITQHLQAVVLNLKPRTIQPQKQIRLIKRVPVRLEGEFTDPSEQFKHYLALGF